MAKAQLKMVGVPHLPYAVVPHPIGGRKPQEVQAFADSIAARVVEILTRPIPQPHWVALQG